MVDIRPNQLPDAILPLRDTDELVVDQGTDGVRKAPPSEAVNSVAPVASQAEAVAGADNTKRMTSLRTKQSIASEVGVTLASNTQGAKADSAVQSVNGKTGNSVNLVKGDVGLGNVDNTSDANKPISTATQNALDTKANSSVTISAGAGLDGGGDLTANRTVSLNAASIASLAKADSSVQTVNGVSPAAGNVTVSAEEKRLQDTRTIAIAESFPSNVLFVETAGYSSVGDGGGALYKRVSSEPTHAGKFQSADGAWWEIVGDKLSVKAFGAKGDGLSSDQLSCQDAVDYIGSRGGGVVIFPEGEFVFDGTLQLPVVDMDLIGNSGSVIRGSVDLVKYPPTCIDVNNVVRLQNIEGLTFKQTGGSHCIVMHQVWTASGKSGHSIKGNRFYITSNSYTTPRCISLQGVWAAEIASNWFEGKGSTNNTEFSGFGVYFQLGSDFNTSIMNVRIHGNGCTRISHPVFMTDQVVHSSDNGRIEGITISGNSFIHGNTGIRMGGWAPASLVTGNMISDFYRGVVLASVTHVNITDNVEISAWNAPILIQSLDTWFSHEGFIVSGNCLKTRTLGGLGADAGILLRNNVADDRIRDICITGNFIFGGLNTTSESGVLFSGSYRCTNVSIVNNVMVSLDYGISFVGSIHTEIITDDNIFRGISGAPVLNSDTNARFKNPGSKVFASTFVESMSGTSYTITVTAPVGYFAAKPISANCELSGEHSDGILCQYDWTNSTATSLKFTATMVDGSALPTSSRRFTMQAFGNGG